VNTFKYINHKQKGVLLLCTLLIFGCNSAVNPTSALDLLSATQTYERCIGGATFENEMIDCQGALIGLSCGGDDEHQPPVLTLKNASVKNLTIAADGASDGINCIAGDCVLENVVWEDICEDATSLTQAGKSMTIRGSWAFNSTEGVGGKPDKIFQHNAGPDSTFIITGGSTAKGVRPKNLKKPKKTSMTNPKKTSMTIIRNNADIHFMN
jgi:hypothetical protein